MLEKVLIISYLQSTSMVRESSALPSEFVALQSYRPLWSGPSRPISSTELSETMPGEPCAPQEIKSRQCKG
jgi:hypothetical protein